MAPPQDLGAAFNRLVQMVSNDMKKAGSDIMQIVNKVMQLEKRISALEQRPVSMNGGTHGTTQIVNGQVVPGPAVEPGIPNASRIFYGDPDAFTQGDDDA